MNCAELYNELKKHIPYAQYYSSDNMTFRVIPIYKRTIYKLMTTTYNPSTVDRNVNFISFELFDFLKAELNLVFHTEVMFDDIYREIFCSQSFKGSEIVGLYELCCNKLERIAILDEILKDVNG